jgi:hypothetical protein
MFPLLAVLLFVGSSVFAEGEIQVFRGSIVAAEPVSGRIALLPDALVFVDDERSEGSFFSSRANVRSVSQDGETVTIQLGKSVRDRAGDTTRLIFKLSTQAEAQALARWHSGAPPEPGSGSAESDSPAKVMTFSAQRKKRLRSNTDGKLIVDHERLIFESVDNASDSRRWDLKEIKELRHRNAYELEIRPFRGEKYVLTLSGAGMDNSQFREIADRVTRARTAR